jgi:hypothetical protein
VTQEHRNAYMRRPCFDTVRADSASIGTTGPAQSSNHAALTELHVTKSQVSVRLCDCPCAGDPAVLVGQPVAYSTTATNLELAIKLLVGVLGSDRKCK